MILPQKEYQPKICDRCYSPTFELYPHKRVDDETGEETIVNYCGRCDWEMMNNWASEDEDLGEMSLRREEEDYNDDPVNNPPPTKNII